MPRNRRSYSDKMATLTSIKSDSAPPLMLILRLLRCSLMFRYIGRIGLFAIASGMNGQEWRRIVGERFCLITILLRLTICLVLHSYKGKTMQKVSGNWKKYVFPFCNDHFTNVCGCESSLYINAWTHVHTIMALDLGRGANPKGYMVEEIWQELARAKYLAWEHESTERSGKLQNLKEACEAALKEKQFLDASQIEGFVDEIAKSNLDQLEALGRVFNKAAEDDTPTEVPDYLCCNITLDLFRDPVITPSGITYERAVILNHLQKVGKFDPVTREPLYESQLAPNLTIKEAVRAYLDKHGWAYKMD